MGLVERTAQRLAAETGGDAAYLEQELREFAVGLLRATIKKLRTPTPNPQPRHSPKPYRQPATNGTATSTEAAEAITPQHLVIRQAIYDYIKSRGSKGATADQIEAVLEFAGNTIRPRLAELSARGLIHRTGDTRLTRAGRKAFVWYIRQGGRS